MFFEETQPKISIRCNYKQKNHDIFNINEIQNEKKNIKKYPDSNSNYNILNCEDNLNYLTFNDYIKNEQAKKINPFQQLEFPNSKKSSIKITQNPGGNQSNKEINYGSKKIINNPYPNNYKKNNSIKIISPFKHKEPVNSIKIIKNPNNIKNEIHSIKILQNPGGNPCLNEINYGSIKVTQNPGGNSNNNEYQYKSRKLFNITSNGKEISYGSIKVNQNPGGNNNNNEIYNGSIKVLQKPGGNISENEIYNGSIKILQNPGGNLSNKEIYNGSLKVLQNPGGNSHFHYY